MPTRKRKTENGSDGTLMFSCNDNGVSYVNVTTLKNCTGKRVSAPSRKPFVHYGPLLSDRLEKVEPCKKASPLSKKTKKLTTSRKVVSYRCSVEVGSITVGIGSTQSSGKSEPDANTIAIGGKALKPPLEKTKQPSDVKKVIAEQSWSQEKADRVAMMKSRYAHTILKAQMKLAERRPAPAPAPAPDAEIRKCYEPKKITKPAEFKSGFKGTYLRTCTKTSVDCRSRNHSDDAVAVFKKPKVAGKGSAGSSESKSEIEKEREAFRVSLETMEETADVWDDMGALREFQMLICGSLPDMQ